MHSITITGIQYSKCLIYFLDIFHVVCRTSHPPWASKISFYTGKIMKQVNSPTIFTKLHIRHLILSNFQCLHYITIFDATLLRMIVFLLLL